MATTNRTPQDLAHSVFSELKKRTSACPSMDLLVKLFECLYFASLRTEESEPITIHVVYLNPENPDPNPPKTILKDRWRFVRLARRVRMSVPNLVKLAKASDPRSSSYAVYQEASGHLSVWGLVDQGNQYHRFVNYESESGPDRPGLFQASIAGVGHLVAYIDLMKIAELKINVLLRSAPDVLRGGPVREKLEPAIRTHLETVRSALPTNLQKEFPDWSQGLSEVWITSICRLLLRIQNYSHGGAILITPDNSLTGLDVKFGIKYDRLRTGIEHQAEYRIKEANASEQIFGEYVERDADEIPVDLYLDETINKGDFEDSRSELEGAIWFVSLLTRVDGLVLMNPHLEVRGFGVEILHQDQPAMVFTTKNRSARKELLRKINYERFGTRHKSMLRYCDKNPASVGFVISQDGDVRVITKVHERLVMWENIKLQLFDFIPHRRRRKKIVSVQDPYSDSEN